MKSLKTPLAYYGGKQRIASKIVPLIWNISHSLYAEPFSGGLAVLYQKGLSNTSNGANYNEAVNDVNRQLIAFWRIARERPQDLYDLIELTPYSKEDYDLSAYIYKNPSLHDDLKIAWSVYVQCTASFAHKILGGWGVTIDSRNQAFSWENKKKRLLQCFDRIKYMHIDCMDSLDFILKWDKPGALFYCDPPYPGTDQGHYSGYSLDDYKNLCDLLDEIKGSYILSNYDQPVAPRTAQECVEITVIVSAPKDVTGLDCERIEKLWICDKSKTGMGIRPVKATIPLLGEQQSLFG